MRCDGDDRDPVLLRSVIPEDPIGRRCGLFGVGLKDLFSLRSFEASELVCPEAWMSRVFRQKAESLAHSSKPLFKSRVCLQAIPLRPCPLRQDNLKQSGLLQFF